MQLISKLSLSLVTVSTLVLGGCQQFTQPQTPASPMVEAENQFHLQGKIGYAHHSSQAAPFLTGCNSRNSLILN